MPVLNTTSPATARAAANPAPWNTVPSSSSSRQRSRSGMRASRSGMLDCNAPTMTETTSPVRGGAVREWASRTGLVAASLIFALPVAEGLSRIFAPISDRRDNLLADGTRITDFLAPGASYRQVSNEYDALTTITPEGYRAPAVA